MKRFLKVLIDLKIDPTNLIIQRLGGGSLGNNSELTPKDFIRFSKKDINDDDIRGLINSLTNAKRAIDCQIDNALEEFGIKPDGLSKASDTLIKHLQLNKKNLPYKLKLIQSLGLAPGTLTSKVRNLRNKLEHYYKIPEKEEVEEAIEIAELFILSIESKIKILDDDYIITSTNFENINTLDSLNNGTYNILDPEHFSTQIRVNFKSYYNKIEIIPIKEFKKQRKLLYKFDNELYYYLIRLMNHLDDQNDTENDLKLIFEYCNHPIPVKNIKLIEYY